MWRYDIPTGRLFDPTGNLAGTGYAGAPGYINDASAVSLKDEGPLPPGMYTITNWRNDPKLGPLSASLIPDPTNVMYGRFGFNLHADKIGHPGCASEGCIVQDHDTRLAVSKSPDNRLSVEVMTSGPTVQSPIS